MRALKHGWPLALAVAALAATPVAAQAPKFVSTHRDWTLYEVAAGKGVTCYIASEPKKQAGTYKQRGNPAVLVARLPGDPPDEQVSVQPGYTYKSGSDVDTTIDGRKFTLFTKGEHAWTRPEDDNAVIEAMRKGSTMVVKGTSSLDTTSTDTYSLAGFTAAIGAMRDACAK